MTEAATNRRHFHRILFDRPVHIVAGEDHFEAQLVDISLKGLLMKSVTPWQATAGDGVYVTVDLGTGDTCCISFDAEVRHVEGDTVGVRAREMDLESAQHLRRLVELNLADPLLLEREFEELIRSG